MTALSNATLCFLAGAHFDVRLGLIYTLHACRFHFQRQGKVSPPLDLFAYLLGSPPRIHVRSFVPHHRRKRNADVAATTLMSAGFFFFVECTNK